MKLASAYDVINAISNRKVEKVEELLNQNQYNEFEVFDFFKKCIESPYNQDIDEIINFLNSESGRRIIAATKWNTFYTDYSMFKYFKKDFYK